MEYVTSMGFKVFSDSLYKIPIEGDTPRIINTISPNSYGISTKDKEFKEALNKSDYLVLDGVYFALASILLQRKNIKRNQGPDVFYHFMQRAEEHGKRVFFLGSTTQTLSLIKTNASIKYPNIIVGTYSPPFKPEFSDNDNSLIINTLNEFQPDIVFVGMTCPKQEKWATKHLHKIDAHLVITIGNVFDWFAGTQKSIKPIWFKLRLAWLIRIFLRPEVFKRNIGNQMNFFWHLIITFLKINKYD